MKKKQKGFTLVEILAAVTILGILSVIAVVSVNNIIQNAKEKHYDTAESQLKLAGQSYTQQNRAALPKAIGQKTKVSLESLVDSNYIEPIKDYSDNDCDIKNSYVQIFKYSQTEYSYLPYLDCPVYTSEDEITKSQPVVTITLSEGNKTKNATATMSATDNEKLLSWSYIVYKDGKEVFNSGSVMIKDYAKNVSKTLDLSKYTPGDLKVVVTATNIYGITTTKTSTKHFEDTQKPTCIIKEEDKNVKAWIKDNRTITVGCNDGDGGSGCKREEYTKTFKTTTKNGTIYIEDNDGNQTACTVTVYVDKTAPTVPTVSLYKWKNNSTTPTSTSGLTAYTAGTWVNLNLYSTASGSTDANSGFDHYEYKSTGKVGEATGTAATNTWTTEGTSTVTYRACDKVGNCSAWATAKTLKLDKTAPSNPTTGLYKWKDNNTRPTTSSSLSGYTANTWSNKNIFTNATGSTETGDVSGFKEYQFTTTGKTSNLSNHAASYRNIEAQGISYIKYRACDNAGNCTSYNETSTIKVDTVNPTITSVTNSSDNVWTTGSVTISANYSDATSGIAEIYYLVGTSTTKHTDWTTNSNGKVTKKFTAEQNNAITIVAVDNAGNTYSKSAGTVKIDTTKPTKPTVGLYKWKNNSTTPTSASNLTAYTSNTWSNKYIYTVASGSTDDDSSVDHYEYTTTGTTTNETNKKGNSRNIQAEGTSTIKYRACDVAGNCSDWSTTYTIKIDKTSPSCSTTTTNSSWTNANVTITGTCSDSGSGCTGNVQETFTTNTNADKSPGTVSDNAGNTTTCSTVRVKIDKTAPTCTTTSTASSWTNSNVTITGTCSDTGGSQCSSATVTKSFDSATNSSQSPGTVTDNAGNSVTCPTINVQIDKTGPSCGTNNGTTTWTSSNRTVTVNCSETSGSGCAKSSYSSTYSTTTTTSSITIYDAAGNSKSCSVNVYVDKTAPSTPTAGAIGTVSGSNTTGSIKTAASGSTDSHSGVSGYRYAVTTSSTAPAKTAVTNTALTFTRSCGTTYYAWAVAVDNVGNVSNVKSLGNTSDGANSYSSWGTCSKTCGGGTQTRTNTCALITDLSQSCNTQSCSCQETVISGYGAWSACDASCGTTGTQYRDVYLVDKYDNSISCGNRATQDTQSCNGGVCPHTHEYGGSYNSISGTYKNYYQVIKGGFSYDNCTCGRDHTIPSSTVMYEGQCIHCANPAGWTWCPCSYGPCYETPAPTPTPTPTPTKTPTKTKTPIVKPGIQPTAMLW